MKELNLNTYQQFSNNGELIDTLEQKYPYFSVPAVIKWLMNNKEGYEKLQRFKPNIVLLNSIPTVENQDAKSSSSELNDIIEKEILYSQDYYAQQGISVSDDIPDIVDLQNTTVPTHITNDHSNLEDEKALLVQMSFEEWLQHITLKKKKLIEEEREKEELKNNWRKQKLAEAIEEESEDIPEDVFKMAVDSIEKEELLSESMAEVYIKQGKYEQALNIYKKLILSFPEKKVYFASKIDILRNNYNL